MQQQRLNKKPIHLRQEVSTQAFNISQSDPVYGDRHT